MTAQVAIARCGDEALIVTGANAWNTGLTLVPVAYPVWQISTSGDRFSPLCGSGRQGITHNINTLDYFDERCLTLLMPYGSAFRGELMVTNGGRQYALPRARGNTWLWLSQLAGR